MGAEAGARAGMLIPKAILCLSLFGNSYHRLALHYIEDYRHSAAAIRLNHLSPYEIRLRQEQLQAKGDRLRLMLQDDSISELHDLVKEALEDYTSAEGY